MSVVVEMLIFRAQFTLSIYQFATIICRSLRKEKSGTCSLVLERPDPPFPIHQLYLTNDSDISFNRGRVSLATWNKTVCASNLRASSDSRGNSGFVVFCPKFLTPQGWKLLNDQKKNGQPQVIKNSTALPFSPPVAIFTDKESEDAEWGHGSFPLEEYVKALERSKGELYYNHSLGMRYSKVCFSTNSHIMLWHWLMS